MAREIWPFEPTVSLSAKLSWLTSILTSYSTEQRAALINLYPRITFTIGSLIQNQDAFYARSIARRAQNLYRIPDWRFAIKVKGTVFSTVSLTIPVDDDFFYPEVGDQCLAWVSPTEYHRFIIGSRGSGTVTAVAGPATAMTNFYITPLLDATCVSGGLQLNDQGNSVYQVSLEFTVTQYKDLTSYAKSYPTQFGFLVLDDRDLLSGDRNDTVTKFVSVIDGGTGIVDIEAQFDTTHDTATFAAKDFGAPALIEREAFFHKMSGRLGQFWKPSWGQDLNLLEDASIGASSISVQLLGEEADFEDRYFVADIGTSKVYFHVTTALTGIGEMVLTLASPLSAGIPLASVKSISEMFLMRFDTDTVDISYEPGIQATISVPVVAVL